MIKLTILCTPANLDYVNEKRIMFQLLKSGQQGLKSTNKLNNHSFETQKHFFSILSINFQKKKSFNDSKNLNGLIAQIEMFLFYDSLYNCANIFSIWISNPITKCQWEQNKTHYC